MPPETLVIKEIHPPTGYSHAVRAGKTVYLAGQVAKDASGTAVGLGDIDAQARQAYANLWEIVRQVGGTWANVAKTTVYLTDARFVEPFRAVRREVLGSHEPPSTLLIVTGLAAPELLVEIEAIVVLD